MKMSKSKFARYTGSFFAVPIAYGFLSALFVFGILISGSSSDSDYSLIESLLFTSPFLIEWMLYSILGAAIALPVFVFPMHVILSLNGFHWLPVYFAVGVLAAIAAKFLFTEYSPSVDLEYAVSNLFPAGLAAMFFRYIVGASEAEAA